MYYQFFLLKKVTFRNDFTFRLYFLQTIYRFDDHRSFYLDSEQKWYRSISLGSVVNITIEYNRRPFPKICLLSLTCA